MKVERDYEELLKLLNKHKVRYCIIGAFAVAFYAKPRYTKDLDLFIDPSVDNSKKIVKALNDFGFKSLKLSAADFRNKGQIIQLGFEPLRVDILTSLKGCSFDRVWKNRAVGNYGNEKVFIIGIQELIRTKRLSGRPLDKIDLDLLIKAQNTD